MSPGERDKRAILLYFVVAKQLVGLVLDRIRGGGGETRDGGNVQEMQLNFNSNKIPDHRRRLYYFV